jgi:hypothetical protein
MLDQLNCAKRQLPPPAEFGGPNVPSLELDAGLAHYASFIVTLANLIIDYESNFQFRVRVARSYVRSYPTRNIECCHFYFTVGGPIALFV